ncbi:tau 95 subunit of transcription factor TFIIIC [Coemansia sp. RSA 552]|nr:tau 95 subunit of transcription factor TFIIIC [Coemansia sp. RSA 552]
MEHTREEKMAQRYPLPEKTVLSVEYPGYVKNTDKAIKSIGGSKKLARIVTEDMGLPIELRYRYDDAVSHPICGSVVPTENLLLKVTRRIRKTRQPDGTVRREAVSTTCKVVAVIDKTVRFRKLADFQYVAATNDPLTIFSKILPGMDIDGIKDLVASDVLDQALDSKSAYIPGPYIDRLGWPSQVPTRKAATGSDPGPEEQPAQQQKEYAQAKQLRAPIIIHFSTASVPTGPTPEILAMCQRVPRDIVDKARKIMDECPVVSRNAMAVMLPLDGYKGVMNHREFMPALAYLMDSGPWRNCWIRHGYDPRQDPEAYKYQVMGIRRVKIRPVGNRMLVNSRRVTKQGQLEVGAHSIIQAQKYIYDNDAVRSKIAGVYQFMHIEVEPVRTLLNYLPGRRSSPCEESGWIHPSLHNLIRIKLRIARKKILGEVLHSYEDLTVDYGELDKMLASDRESQQDDEEVPARIEERRRNQVPRQLSEETRQHVDARVDEFMRILNTQQRGMGTAQNEDGDDGLDTDMYLSEASEFDIFEYEDED